MAREIPLTKGFVAIVDDEDFEFLSQWKWHARKTPGGNVYASRSIWKGERRSEHMHRVVNRTPEGFITDHINGVTLDNRKANLRTATKSQNHGNVGPRARSKSKIKGVTFDKARGKWAADIQFEGQRRRLGRFDNLEAAAAAYDRAASELFGEFKRRSTND